MSSRECIPTKEQFIANSVDVTNLQNAHRNRDISNDAADFSKNVTDFQKILMLNSLSEKVSIPSELDMNNSIKMMANSQNPAKITFGAEMQGASTGAGDVFADTNTLHIKGMSQSGNPRSITMDDKVKVSQSIDAPIYTINGQNAFDFTSDGALRINPPGTSQFKNVNVNSGLLATGSVTGNTVCVGDTNNCLTTDSMTNIGKISSISSKLDAQYLTMDQAVKKAAKDMEENLGTKCTQLNNMVDASGNLRATGSHVGFKNRGEALTENGWLNINAYGQWPTVNIGSSTNVNGSLNVQNKLFFSDVNRNTNPDWWGNNSDPYYLEKRNYGGNNNHLRLTINDDWDESFQIWGDSCRMGNCAGEGTLRHYFRADGYTYHANSMGVSGAIYPDWGLWSWWGGVGAYAFYSRAGFYWWSDINMKEDIKKLDSKNMLEKIKRIDGYKYKLKADQKQHYGLIAQYLEKEFPEMVSEDEDGTKSLDYTQLIPVLIETVKDVNERLEKLEKKSA